MNNDFEKHLGAQPFRQLPPDWKNEILRAASCAAQTKSPAHSAQLSGIIDWLRAILWPSPAAWGVMASIWLLLLGIGTISRSEASNSAPISMSSRQLEMVRQQQAWVRDELGIEVLASHQQRFTAPAIQPGPRSHAPAFQDSLQSTAMYPNRETIPALA